MDSVDKSAFYKYVISRNKLALQGKGYSKTFMSLTQNGTVKFSLHVFQSFHLWKIIAVFFQIGTIFQNDSKFILQKCKTQEMKI